MGFLKNREGGAEAAQFEPALAPVRAELLHQRPELATVVHFPEMGEFVGDDVIDHGWRQEHQAPIETMPPRLLQFPARARR